MDNECYSIEEKIDFKSILNNTDTIAVVYPIYGSCVSRIMREFVEKYIEKFKNKKLIIFCTQMLFSGDGARAFARLILDCDKNIIYAEHFMMPNNICNFFLFPMNNKGTLKKVKKADKKLDRVCNNIRKGIIRKRGWNIISKLLGKTQNIAYPKMEEKARHSFMTDSDCTQCALCVKVCSMDNLEIINGKVVQKDNCTICYRCVNICPQKAAIVYFRSKPKEQYKGIKS